MARSGELQVIVCPDCKFLNKVRSDVRLDPQLRFVCNNCGKANPAGIPIWLDPPLVQPKEEVLDQQFKLILATKADRDYRLIRTQILRQEIKTTAAAFVSNIDRAIAIVEYSCLLVGFGMMLTTLNDLAYCKVVGLPRSGKFNADNPVDDGRAIDLRQKMFDEWTASPAAVIESLYQGKRWVDQLGLCLAPRDVGIVALLASQVVAAWTAFEVLAVDLLERSWNLKPEPLARAAINNQPRREDDDHSDTPASSKSPRLKQIESYIGSDLAAGREVGSHLLTAGKFVLNSLHGIQQAYYCTFGKDTEPLFSDDGLEVLHGLRNAFVHAAGRADRAYRQRVKRHSKKYQSLGLSGFELDRPIPIDGDLVRRLVDSASRSGTDLLKYVNEWLDKHP